MNIKNRVSAHKAKYNIINLPYKEVFDAIQSVEKEKKEVLDILLASDRRKILAANIFPQMFEKENERLMNEISEYVYREDILDDEINSILKWLHRKDKNIFLDKMIIYTQKLRNAIDPLKQRLIDAGIQKTEVEEKINAMIALNFRLCSTYVDIYRFLNDPIFGKEIYNDFSLSFDVDIPKSQEQYLVNVSKNLNLKFITLIKNTNNSNLLYRISNVLLDSDSHAFKKLISKICKMTENKRYLSKIDLYGRPPLTRQGVREKFTYKDGLPVLTSIGITQAMKDFSCIAQKLKELKYVYDLSDKKVEKMFKSFCVKLIMLAYTEADDIPYIVHNILSTNVTITQKLKDMDISKVIFDIDNEDIGFEDIEVPEYENKIYVHHKCPVVFPLTHPKTGEKIFFLKYMLDYIMKLYLDNYLLDTNSDSLCGSGKCPMTGR